MKQPSKRVKLNKWMKFPKSNSWNNFEIFSKNLTLFAIFLTMKMINSSVMMTKSCDFTLSINIVLNPSFLNLSSNLKPWMFILSYILFSKCVSLLLPPSSLIYFLIFELNWYLKSRFVNFQILIKALILLGISKLKSC